LYERFGLARALPKTGFPSIKEPQGLLRPHGKRPDGLTLTPWQDGRCVTWDVTVTDTVAASYLNSTASCAGSAAEAAALRKVEKYAEMAAQYLFVPLAFATFGPINQAGCDFLSSLGHYLSLVSDDPRENLPFSFNAFPLLCSASTLFLHLIREPASTIVSPAETHPEFIFFSLIYPPLGRNYQRQKKYS
jgi:hypothetical protein